MAVSRNDLARKFSQMKNIKLKEALEIIDAFFEEVTEQLTQGFELKFSRFGKFKLQDKSARIGRNPLTGKEYPIQARRTAVFDAAVQFREQLTNAHLKET